MENELLYSECREGACNSCAEDENYRFQELANAVIMQAAQDLYRALRANRRRNTAQTRKQVKELEGFLRSNWYRMLTDRDGEKLIARIRADALNGTAQQRCRG